MHHNVRLLFVVQYVSTSPRDDWIVQDCGVVGSSRSAECASQPHECDEEEEPGMQLDVRDSDCFFMLVCLLCSIAMSVLVVHVHVIMVQCSVEYWVSSDSFHVEGYYTAANENLECVCVYVCVCGGESEDSECNQL